MSKKHIILVEVEARKNEEFERLIRKFQRKVKNEKILEEIRERTWYEKPSTARHKAKLKAEYYSRIELKKENSIIGKKVFRKGRSVKNSLTL